MSAPSPVLGSWALDVGCWMFRPNQRFVRLVPLQPSLALLSPKHVPDRLQIFHPVHRVRLEVAAFGPLVPAVDVEDARPVRLRQQALLRQLQRLAEALGRVAADGVRERIAEVAELVALVARAGWSPSPSSRSG